MLGSIQLERLKHVQWQLITANNECLVRVNFNRQSACKSWRLAMRNPGQRQDGCNASSRFHTPDDYSWESCWTARVSRKEKWWTNGVHLVVPTHHPRQPVKWHHVRVGDASPHHRCRLSAYMQSETREASNRPRNGPYCLSSLISRGAFTTSGLEASSAMTGFGVSNSWAATGGTASPTSTDLALVLRCR